MNLPDYKYWSDGKGTLYLGDCLEVLKLLPSNSVDCCVSSPPYWHQRDYKVEGQLGIEESFIEYIDRLVTIFDEVKRILKPTGTCFVNLGDTYHNATKWTYLDGAQTISGGNPRDLNTKRIPKQGLPEKCLCLIPYRFAIEMVSRGWTCRNVLIWYKPRCMPESVKDRFTTDFEPIFFFTKGRDYYFEQQLEPYSENSNPDEVYAGKGIKNYHDNNVQNPFDVKRRILESMRDNKGRNKRCVWKVNFEPSLVEHFAVYPRMLVQTPIQAGCPEFICKKCGKAKEKIFDSSERVATRAGEDVGSGKCGTAEDPNKELHKSDLSRFRQRIVYKEAGYSSCDCGEGFDSGIVLDPFVGSGTTCVVAKYSGRRYIGIDLKKEYLDIAKSRLAQGVLF